MGGPPNHGPSHDWPTEAVGVVERAIERHGDRAAAHHFEGYAPVAGLLFPRGRRVFGLLTGMNLLTVDLDLSPLPETRLPGGATSHA